MKSRRTIRKALLRMSINEATSYTYGLEKALEHTRTLRAGMEAMYAKHDACITPEMLRVALGEMA